MQTVSIRKKDTRLREAFKATGTARATSVFVSYARRDASQFAHDLVAQLAGNGFDAYLDEKDIAPGEDWRQRLGELVLAADVIVFVVSPGSVASEICRWEVDRALQLGKRLLPLMFISVPEDDIPADWSRRNYVFFDGSRPFGAEYQKLQAAISTEISWVREHTRLSQIAERWRGKKRSQALLLRGNELESAQRWLSGQPRNAPPPSEVLRSFLFESRKAATRRQRFLLVAALATVVATLGLAALFAQQSAQNAVLAEAEAQNRKTAEHNLSVAKGAANAIVFDLARGLRNIQGVRADTVRTMLASAEQAFRKLAETAKGDAEILSSQSAMYNEFADTYASLGMTDNQLAAANASLSIAKRLSEAVPNAADHQLALSVSHEKLADALVQRGDAVGALDHYKLRHDIVGALLASDPNNASWLRELSVAKNNLGKMSLAQRNLDGAVSFFSASRAIREQLSAADPSSPDRLYDLARSHALLGDGLVSRAELMPALGEYRKFQSIMERLSSSDPNKADWQRDLSVALQKVGQVLQATNAPADALAAYQKSIAVVDRLVRSDPDNLAWRRDRLTNANNIGDTLASLDRLDEAAAAYREAMATTEHLISADPGNTQWQRDLAVSHEKLGKVFSKQKKKAEALGHFGASFKILNRLLVAAPEDVQLRFDVQSLSWRLADLGDDPVNRFKAIVSTLRDLRDKKKLNAAQEKLVPVAEKELATRLRPIAAPQ